MHKMSKESAASLSAAYGEVAKYREAFDIAVKYIRILINYSLEHKTFEKGVISEEEKIDNEFRNELMEKVGISPYE